jgi:hypothetical protein
MALPVGARLLTADPVTEAQRLPPSTKPSHDARARQQNNPSQQPPEGR